MWNMTSKLFTKKDQLEELFYRGFPSGLVDNVKKVVCAIPRRTYSDIRSYTSEEEVIYLLRTDSIIFPYRLYLLEINNDELLKLNDIQKMVLHCIYSRSCDGYVREKHIRELLATDIPYWTIPYIVKVCDEYVVEILWTVYEGLLDQDTDKIKQFCANNWKSLCRSYNRMVSYWNEFYRYDCYRFRDYIGRKLFIECFGAKRKMNCSDNTIVEFDRDRICTGDDLFFQQMQE